MVDVQASEEKRGFEWVGFDNLVSLQFVSDYSTLTSVSVAYARPTNPKQSLQLQEDAKRSMTSSNDRGNDIISKMPLNALKTLVTPIEEGILDMQTVFYLKNDSDTDRIAVSAEDFLQIVYSHVASIAKQSGLPVKYWDENNDADDASLRLQDLKSMLEKLTNYEDSNGYATLLPTRANAGAAGMIDRQHEPSYSSVTSPSAEVKLGVIAPIQLENKKNGHDVELKLKIASVLAFLLALAVFLGLGLYLGFGKRTSLPHFSTTTTNTPVTTPINATLITDCYDWRYKLGYEENGIYTIYPNGTDPFDVYCDMVTDGGGWTVFQKRQDNSLVFWNRSWADYKNGFNNGLERNAWLGLDRIHLLSTKDDSVTLRIDLRGNRDKQYSCDPVDVFLFAEWDFKIDGEENQYRLHLKPWKAGNLSYPGDDYLQQNNNQPFSTIDHDNTINVSIWLPHGCLAHQDSPIRPYNWGAWWYSYVGYPMFCGNFFLNGKYDPPRPGWTGFTCLHTSTDHPVNGTYHEGGPVSEKYHPCFVQPKRSEMKLRKNG